MPCIKSQLSPNQPKQLLLELIIAPAGSITLEHMKEGTSIKVKTAGKCMALIDTGATNSCITREIAEEIGIIPDGQLSVSGVQGEHLTNTYHADIYMPQVGLHINNITLLEGNFPQENGKYNALLGMDILSRGTLHYDFSGSYVFCV